MSNARDDKLIPIGRNTVKWLCSDGGGDHVEIRFRKWILKRDIVREVTTAFFPESIGAAKKFDRTFLDMARTMVLNNQTPCKEL